MQLQSPHNCTARRRTRTPRTRTTRLTRHTCRRGGQSRTPRYSRHWPRHRHRNTTPTNSRQRRQRRTGALRARTRPLPIQRLIQRPRRAIHILPTDIRMQEIYLSWVRIRILFIAPGAEVVDPCYWCGRVRGDEIPVLVEQRHVRAWIGDEGVEVGGENGVPEGAVAGVVVYWEGGDSADVDSGYGEVGVRADCAVGDGAGAV